MTDQTPEEVAADAKAEAAKVEDAPVQEGAVTASERELGGALIRLLVDHERGRKAFSEVIGSMVAARQMYAMCVRDLEIRLGELTGKEKKDLLTAAIADLTEGSIFTERWERFYPEGDEEPHILKHEESLKEELDAMDESKRRHAMKKALVKEFEEMETDGIWEIIEEMFLQAATFQASKPFDEGVLFRGMRETVFPWMTRVVSEHDKKEQEERRRDIEESEKHRRENPIPLGVKYDPVGGKLLGRTQPLVLAGWQPAVWWIIDQMVSHILAANKPQLYTVIRLQREMHAEEMQPRLLRLGGKDWRDCTSTNSSFAKLFEKRLLMQLSATGPMDVLVCDDLALAGESHGIVGGESSRKAGHAQRQLRKFCEKMGAALIGAVVFDSKDKSVLEGIGEKPEWSQLRTHTMLRAVTVEEVNEGNYQLTLGNNCQSFDVPKELLDSRGPKRIIVP